jgi:threonine/homoserine/homoserine lactone efflux protein
VRRLFIASFIISFLGSVQLGPVSLAIIKSTLETGVKSAIYIAIGGIIPELIYSWLAINSSEIKFLNQHLLFLRWLIIPVFISIGFYNILRKKKATPNNQKKEQEKKIMVGFLLALFNIQLFPFWLSVNIFLKSFKFIHISTNLESIAFIAGAAVGAFGLFVLIIYLTNRHKIFFISKLSNYNLNNIFGWLFVILGLIQLLNLLFNT